jgi:ABC-type transport system substrate-binding protein
VALEDINKVLAPAGVALDTPVAPASPFYLPELAGSREYDPAGAQELLEQAGWLKGGDGIRRKDGQPLEVSLTYTQTSPEMAKIASVLQQELKAIGVELKLSAVESGALFASLAARDYDLIAAPGIGSSSLDFETDYHGSSGYSVAADTNLDSLIEKYHTAPNFEEQKLVGKKIQETILHDNLVLLFINSKKTFAHTARLQNFKPSLMDAARFSPGFRLLFN